MTVKTITIGFGAAGLAAMLCLGSARDARAYEDAEAKFQKLDKNGDGKISEDEFEESAEAKFKMMDTNGDEKLSVAELSAARDSMGGKASDKLQATAAEKVKMMDTNHDGVISEDEFEESSKMMFQKLDADHDGYVTKAEMKAGHEKMKAEGAGAGAEKKEKK